MESSNTRWSSSTEWISGRLVEQEGPQSTARTLRILQQVTAALAEAHEAGLVHHDVKPENVMLCQRGGVPDFVKVLDFGLVKEIGAGEAAKITAESTIAGTPLYLAPEAVLAPHTVGPAVDVYAVGCVAYFLLTGRPPFDASNLVEICAAHRARGSGAAVSVHTGVSKRARRTDPSLPRERSGAPAVDSTAERSTGECRLRCPNPVGKTRGSSQDSAS